MSGDSTFDQSVEAGMRWANEREGSFLPMTPEEFVGGVLRAALAHTPTVECETCGGTRELAKNVHRDENDQLTWDVVSCPDCTDGRVPTGERLIIGRQVGTLWELDTGRRVLRAQSTAAGGGGPTVDESPPVYVACDPAIGKEGNKNDEEA